MSPGPESTHPCLLNLETAIPCLGFSSKAVQLSAGRIFSVCPPAYSILSITNSYIPLPPCASYSDFFKFISVAAPGLSYSTWSLQSND